jgi:hypothetical protein
MECLHNDDDKDNNGRTNLRWGTRSENMRDQVINGRHWQTKKDVCPIGHKLISPNLVPGHHARKCRACNNTAWYKRTHSYEDWVIRANQRYEVIMKGVML